MKRKLSKFTVTLLFVAVPFIFKSPILAQGVNFAFPNPSRFESLEEVINALASLIQPIFMLTFGAMILYGAFMLLTSQGNEEKIVTSRKTIIAAIIGFVIAVLAPTIVNFITSLLGVDGLNILGGP